MMGLLPATLVASVVLVAADQVPTFNVEPSCRAAASRTTSPDYASVCRETEKKARDDVARLWPNLSATDKSECVPLSKMGGRPTYTELLTCLEMARDARSLRRRGSEPVTTGQGIRP